MTKHRLLSFSLFALTILALFGISKLRIFHDLDGFFPEEDADLDFYNEHRAYFPADDNFVYIALVNESGIFDSVFLQKSNAFTKACDSIPHIEGVTSLTTLQSIIKTPFGTVPVSVLHFNEPEKYAVDSTHILQDERVVGRYISEDATVFSIVIVHKEHTNADEIEAISGATNAIVERFEGEFDDIRVAGRAVTLSAIVGKIGQEFVFYAFVATILAVLVMSLLLRRFWGVVIACVSVAIGLVWFMGFLGLTGKTLDIMSTLFPTLAVMVGLSDVIHILTKYMDEIHKGLRQKDALKIAIKEIGWATLLTSLTTAVGFLSLYTANISALKIFGLYAAAGVILTYIAVLGVMVVLLPLIPPEKLVNQQTGDFWYRSMDWIFRTVKTRRKLIAGISIGVFAVCLVGISKISTNAFLLDDLPRSNTIRKDFLFFEEKLSGARPFEMAVIPQKDYKINDLKVLQQIDTLVSYLQNLNEIGVLTSPAMIYKSLHQSNNGNNLQYYRLPPDELTLQKYELQLKQLDRKNATASVMTKDRKYARINGNMLDLGSEPIAELNQQIKEWITENTDAGVVQFRLTGSGVVLDKNHQYLRQSLFTGLGVAFLVVSLLMALLFRDLQMSLIALIPNIFPLLITGAVMGYFGISLKASTSIIFTLAFGIAVDDTIHFLSKLKLQFQKGLDLDTAIRNTFLETGKALCITTFILFCGFGSLAFSDFAATFYIGLLLSITLLSALVADLFLLPVVIYWWKKRSTKTK
ncbi:MAG: MMPL family transporter [Chitinophagales bacterium]